jgi:hypothetical protein
MKKTTNYKIQITKGVAPAVFSLLGIPNFKMQITNKHKPSPQYPNTPFPQITLHPSLTILNLFTQIGSPCHGIGGDSGD